MELVVCPHCETRVVPMSGGECPACRRRLDEPLDEAPGCPDHHDDWGELPATTPTEPVSLATIRTFLFVAEAELARGFLEELGIPAFLANAEIVAMNWLLANAIGYVKLQVPSSEALEAMDLLRECGAARPDRELLQDEEGEVPDEESPAGMTGVLDRLRSLKQPILWLYLCPALLAFVVGFFAALFWFVQSAAGIGGHGRF